jgi:hypothetical protein
MTRGVIHSFIDSQQLAVFSTISATGNKPQSALLGIAVTPNLEIVFDTVPLFPQIPEPDSESRRQFRHRLRRRDHCPIRRRGA